MEDNTELVWADQADTGDDDDDSEAGIGYQPEKRSEKEQHSHDHRSGHQAQNLVAGTCVLVHRCLRSPPSAGHTMKEGPGKVCQARRHQFVITFGGDCPCE